MSDQTLSRAPTTRDTSAPTSVGDDSLAWSDMRLPGFTPMDNVHEEFHALALKLMTCSDADTADAIERLEQHAISHLEQEDEWMRSTNFSPRDCHLAEHVAVLKSVGDIKQAAALGKAGADVARNLGMALFDWFPICAGYLDSALAAWMAKQTMGGKPIVLRRTLA